MEDVEATGQSSPLGDQIQLMTQDLDWTLSHFTFVADVTTLANECDVAHSPAMSVASCYRFASPALAFLGDSPDLLANYASFLADPDSEIYLLVNDAQRPVVESAFEVLETIPEWQLVFQGDPEALDPGPAERLTHKDASAMHALAKGEVLATTPYLGNGVEQSAENGPVTTAVPWLDKDPLSNGPAFGVWKGRKLVSMATTRLRVPGAAEIGTIVTHKEHRRQGYATAVTSALVQALAQEEICVFLMVYQSNTQAISIYEQLGFVIARPMYLMRCVIKESGEDLEALRSTP